MLYLLFSIIALRSNYLSELAVSLLCSLKFGTNILKIPQNRFSAHCNRTFLGLGDGNSKFSEKSFIAWVSGFSDPRLMDPFERRTIFISDSTLGDEMTFADGMFAKKNIPG